MEVDFISVGKITLEVYDHNWSAIDNDDTPMDCNSTEMCKVNNIEVPDEKCPEKLSNAEMEIVKNKEGERILSKISSDIYVVALAIEGEQVSTEKFLKKIKLLVNQGKHHFAFVIGGSLGLSDVVLKRANYKLSFSKMTFPHQLMKVILTEQIEKTMKHIRF